MREVLTGASEAVTVRIYGQDLKLLREKATEVDDILGRALGVIENHVELQEEICQVHVEADLAAAKWYGINPGDVRRAAAWLMVGEEAGGNFGGGKTCGVQMWTPPEKCEGLIDLETPPSHPAATTCFREGIAGRGAVSPPLSS